MEWSVALDSLRRGVGIASRAAAARMREAVPPGALSETLPGALQGALPGAPPGARHGALPGALPGTRQEARQGALACAARPSPVLRDTRPAAEDGAMGRT